MIRIIIETILVIIFSFFIVLGIIFFVRYINPIIKADVYSRKKELSKKREEYYEQKQIELHQKVAYKRLKMNKLRRKIDDYIHEPSN